MAAAKSVSLDLLIKEKDNKGLGVVPKAIIRENESYRTY